MRERENHVNRHAHTTAPRPTSASTPDSPCSSPFAPQKHPLFCTTLLLGGAIWGPLWGTLFVVIGSNMSATLAYSFGRVFGQGVIPVDAAGPVPVLVLRGVTPNGCAPMPLAPSW
ncbi:MAG: hypothetical protein AB4911_22435 [Oscillochloridaceae bacterium umkhey_bin13]